MNVNKLYDAIIIGYNDDTKYLLKNCLAAGTDQSYAVISETAFDCEEKIDAYFGEVTLLRYNRGLISVFRDCGPALFGKRLILAVGTRPKLLKFDDKAAYYENVYYNVDFKKTDINVANRRVIVVGDSDDTLKNSLLIAKSAKEVYICSSDSTLLDKYDRLTRRLKNKPDNIRILINSEIIDIVSEAGVVGQVTLNTYSKIDCDLVIGYLGTTPDVRPFLNRYVTVSPDQKIITTETGQTGPLPNVYAIGECTDYKDKNQKNSNIVKIAKMLKGD